SSSPAMRRASISSSMVSRWSWSSLSPRAASPVCSRDSGPGWRRRRRSAAMAETLLAVEDVSKQFDGLLALDHASLAVEPGTITALIGPNGAGKTTLFSIVAGFQRPTRGRIRYSGADITGEATHRLARRGIARTFQIVQPFAGLSVRENIA